MSTGQSTGSVHTCAAELHVSDGVEGGLESTLEGSLLGLPASWEVSALVLVRRAQAKAEHCVVRGVLCCYG